MNRSAAIFLVALLGVCVVARAQEAPPFTAELSLVRYDMPRGRSDGLAPTRQLAQRRDGPDAVEWPDCTLNGRPIFRGQAEEQVPMRLRATAEAKSPFVQPGDEVIQPGNHWLRPVQWLRNRKHLYTADKTARCAASSEAPRGRYELWLFPILLRGEGGPTIKNVVLKTGGAVVFQKNGPWRTLTLLLPANETGKPYELSVDGRPAVQFDAGLMPVKLGNPVERVFPVNTVVPGDGPKIAVLNLARPDEFPNQKEWNADVAALAQTLSPGGSAGDEVKIAAPVSPMLIYATALPHGMSGGFWKKGMNADDYAAQLAAAGFDAVFEQGNAFGASDDPESIETRAAALAKRGLRLGLQYDNNWSRPSLQHPNLAILAHTLPEWHAPLYRSLQLTAQRFARLPNFLGVSIGGNNAGYVADWPWAPPSPDRPWGEAMVEFAGAPQPRIPIAPTLWPREFPFEQPAQTQGEFIKYVERYETSFRQYGYFAEAVREVDPRLVFTTGSFGSSPGAGARGGWPWASVPGRLIYEGLKVQQIYDWNQTHSSKPLHNVAMVDRMRSYYPQNKTWSLIDNNKLFFGREAMQRAVALVLSRGVQGVGTNFLASPAGENARPDVNATQRELHEWIHQYGGVYAMTEPEPVIGVFYSHLACVQRRMNTDEDAPPDALARGSHEGKVTEALWLCHAAGWPARVITYQEVMRGPLPASMKAIVLAGLDQPDETWSWGPGLETALNQFLARGGRILADDESGCAVPFTKTKLHIASYVTQSELDATPRLLARNRGNIDTLRRAMEGVAAPIAASDEPTLWAIPARAGDTQYVTAVNWAFAEGDEAKEFVRPADARAAKPEVWKTKANASLYVKPQSGALRWETERPIYDVRLRRKITPAEAAECDLTADGFRWYALPPAEVVKPGVAVERGVSGFYEAHVTMSNGVEMTGVPVSIALNATTVYAATGDRVRLDAAPGGGPQAVVVTELLTGLSTETTFTPEAVRAAPRRRDDAALAKFAARKHVPLTIALTAEQGKDAKIVAAAKTLAKFYEQQGRKARIGRASPDDVVESLQPLKSPHRFPQWKTIASDIVLFGTPGNNVLLLDQMRAGIFPRDFAVPKAGEFELLYTRSPFVGEYDAVNIVAADASACAAAVARLASAKP